MAISEAKLAANRANAQKSTGPRTEEGKARSSRNHLKHGLLSQRVLLDSEDAEAFDEFSSALREELDPRGPWEETLAEQVVSQAWRLRRAAWMETCLLEKVMVEARRKDAEWRKNQWDWAKHRAGQKGLDEAGVPEPFPRPSPGEVMPRFAGEALAEMMNEATTWTCCGDMSGRSRAGCTSR